MTSAVIHLIDLAIAVAIAALIAAGFILWCCFASGKDEQRDEWWGKGL
jgi:hypothetical protein